MGCILDFSLNKCIFLSEVATVDHLQSIRNVRCLPTLMHSHMLSSVSGVQMPRNELTRDEIKKRVLDLKNDLYHEPYSEGITFLADKYLNRVLDIIDEYRY